MYTALQARNIANERVNHLYYRVYKHQVHIIMRNITKWANKGKTRLEYETANTRLLNDVLSQIASELATYGYDATVTRMTGKNNRTYLLTVIEWGNAGADEY